MMSARTRLILIGAGHAHVEVLRSFAKARPPAEVTVISPARRAPYTGMAPGRIAGRWRADETTIDAAALAHRADAAFRLGHAIAIDRSAGLVHCSDGAALPFDILSLDIGAAACGLPSAPGAVEVIPSKPAETFFERLEARLAADAKLRWVVVGGGYGGIEIAGALARRSQAVSLVTGRAGLAPGAPAAARAAIGRRLAARGVALAEGADAVGAEADGVALADGRRIVADAAVMAAGRCAPALIETLDLAKDADGFLRVCPTLRSVGDARIFAAGDCASFPAGDGRALAKSGVHAVRQGPVLARNLRAAIAGAALAPFHPQTEVLSILSFWPDGAVAIRGRFWAEGRWVDAAKAAIDRGFIARYAVPAG